MDNKYLPTCEIKLRAVEKNLDNLIGSYVSREEATERSTVLGGYRTNIYINYNYSRDEGVNFIPLVEGLDDISKMNWYTFSGDDEKRAESAKKIFGQVTSLFTGIISKIDNLKQIKFEVDDKDKESKENTRHTTLTESYKLFEYDREVILNKMIRWGVRNPTDLNAVYDEFEKTITFLHNLDFHKIVGDNSKN